MLEASGHFNIVTARHVICYDELGRRGADREGVRRCLRKRFEDLGLSTRGVDVVRLSPDTPEEYGFILDNLGLGLNITGRNFRAFQRICELIQRDAGKHRPLLLKNPTDFGNERRIKSLMPESKFVHIHRNPFHTISSSFRMITGSTNGRSDFLAMLSRRYVNFVESEFPPRLLRLVSKRCPSVVVKALIHNASWVTSLYLRNRSAVSPEDRIDIQYEELCDRPNETIARILTHFGFADRGLDYRGMIGKHASRVASEVAADRNLIIRKLSNYAAAVGYDLSELVEEMN